MKEESTGVSPVIATILLIAITVVAVGVVMAFVAGLGTPATRPIASLSVTDSVGDNNRLVLTHNGGDDILWKDIEIAVVEGADAPAAAVEYRDPGDVIQSPGTALATGESVYIHRQTTDGDVTSLEVDETYHILLRHVPSKQIILDTNCRVTAV